MKNPFKTLAGGPDGGTGFAAQLAKIREDIAGCKNELAHLNDAPLPLTEAKQAADAFIESLVSKGGLEDRAAAFFLPGRRGDHVAETFRQQGEVWDGVGKCFTDLGPVLASLFPEMVRARLYALLEAQAEALECGPPSAERPAIRADVEKRLFDLEIEEEQLIEQAEAAGVELYRRADVNPAAVIGIF